MVEQDNSTSCATTTKPVFRIADKARPKPVFSATIQRPVRKIEDSLVASLDMVLSLSFATTEDRFSRDRAQLFSLPIC